MGGIHGIELMLLRDVGMKASVIIHKTETLKRLLSPEAIEEVQNITLGWAREYGSDPEILINSAFDEEIETIKKTGTDLVILPSLTSAAHKYNKEGIRTFDSFGFMLHHQRIGFECSIELAIQLKEALKKPQRRNPLLGMLKYDPYKNNLIPHWATLADMFMLLREGAVGDKDRLYS